MIYITIISLLIQIYLYKFTSESKYINKLLAASIVFYSILWIFIPGFISILIYFDLIDDRFKNFVISDRYIFLFAIESLIVFLVFYFGIFFSKKLFERECGNNFLIINYKFIYTILLIFIFAIFFHYFVFGKNTYLEINDARMYDRSILEIFISIALSFSKSTIIYIFIFNNKGYIINFILFLSIFICSFLEVSVGSRIAMFVPLFILICKVYFVQSNTSKKKIVYSVIIAFSLIIILSVSLIIAEVRQGNDNDYLSDELNSGVEISFASITYALFGKFDNFRAGLDLIKVYGEGRAGYRPYIGAALIFLPRSIFPARPVAGSVDGTIYGVPSRLVAQLFSNSESLNVGVSPLAISIWHFGWILGGFLLFITGIINFLLIQYLFLQKHLIYRVIGVNALQIPVFLGVFYSPDTMIRNDIQIFLFFLFVYLIKKILIFRRHVKF